MHASSGVSHPHTVQRPAPISIGASSGADPAHAGEGHDGAESGDEHVPPSNAFLPSSVRRSTSRFLGLDTGSALPEDVTPADLVEQGIPPSQASRVIARQREHDVVHRLFGYVLVCFCCTLCIMIPTLLAMLIWTVVEYFRNLHTECDAPLQTWFETHIIVFSIHHFGFAKCAARCFCHWPDPENPMPMPILLKLYNLIVPLFLFVWNCVGLYWVAADGSGNERPPCEEVASGLYSSVKAYVIFNIFAICVFVVYLIGPLSVLIFAVRRGILQSPEAAPKGTVDKVTESVTADDPAVVEANECSICMARFDEGTETIVKTTCNHIFHKSCLKTWLERIKGNCPLCRTDLSS